MLDIYWHGEVTRISPEAPAMVFAVKHRDVRDGASANVAANVKAMGVEVRTDFGDWTDSPIEKIRLVSKGQQLMRVDFDYPQKAIRRLVLSDESVVIFVDYGKGSLRDVQCLIREAKQAGKTVLVDPKGYDYEKYRGCDVIKPNLDEMRVMVGGWKDEDDLTRKALDLCKKAEIGSMLLTRAADGMSLYTEGKAIHIPAVAKEVVDVTGAGETAIAALGVGLHRGLSLVEASRYANKAAGIKVGRFGPSVVTEAEVFA